jgi:hypothetical protein
MVPRVQTIAMACCLLLVASLALGACGNAKKQGVDEPAREGLALPLGGLDYNVFITRELNLRIPPDSAYYKGPEPPKGETLYGVFLQVCNRGDKPRQTARKFTVTDNQGNKFEPTPLPPDDAFAYQPQLLGAGQCIPQAGSVAQLGPTDGALLLFRFPVSVTENRPLDLEIDGPSGPVGPKRNKLTFELDL